MNAEQLKEKDGLEYWVRQAEAVYISYTMTGHPFVAALQVGAFLRQAYLEGKKDGVWEYNNGDRGCR